MGDSIERANDATVNTDGGEETSNRLLAASTDSSAVKPAGQSGNRLLSMSTSTGTPFVESSSTPAFDTVKRSLAGEATHSFFYSLAQRPVTGLSQVFDNTLGKPFNSDVAGSTKFMDAPKPTAFGSAEWHAQTAGGTVGMLPWFIGAFKVSKGALGGYRATAAEMTALGSRSLLYRPSTVAIAEGATAGFLHDAILAPTDPSAGNFFVERGKHGLVGAATFGTLTAATIGLKAFGAAAGETTLVGRAMENRILNPALAGVPAAVASEAAGIVVLGHDPSLESLGKTTYTMVLVGGGLGAFHSVPGRGPARAAEGRTVETAETRTGPEILSGKIEAARLEVQPVEKSTAGDRRIATPETALAGKETAAEPIKFNVTGDPAVVETFQRGANSAIRAVQEPSEANVATFKQFAAGEGKSMGTIMLEMANQLNSKAFVDLVREAYKIDEPTALTVRGQALAKLAADPQSQQPSRTEPFFEYARNEGADKGPELLRYAQETGNKRLEIVVKEAYLLKEGKTAPRSSDPVSLKLTQEQAQRFAGFVNLVKDLPMESGNYAQFRYNLFTWMNANPDLVPAVIDYAARHPASQIAGPVDYYAPEHSSSLRRFPTIEGVKAPEPGLIDSDRASVPSDFARPLHPMEGRGTLIYSRGGHGVYDYSNPAAGYKVLETRDGGQIFYYQTGGEKPGYATLIYMPDGRVGHRYTESSGTQFYEKSASGPSQLRQREGLDPDMVDWMTRVEAEAGIKSTATSLSIPDGKTAPVEPVDNNGRTGNDTAVAADAGLPRGRRLWQLFAREQTPGHARQLTENFGDLSPAEFKQWLDYVTNRPEGLPAEAPPPNLAKLWVPSASVLAREPIIRASEASPEGKGPLESYHRFLSKPAKSIPDFPDWLAEFVRERFREAEATAPDGAKPHEILDLALPRQLSRYIRTNYMDINTTQPLENPANNTLPADIRARFEAANQSDTRGNPVGRPPREEGNTVADRMDRLNELLDIPDATIRNRLIDLGGQDHPKLKNITSKLNPETAAPEYAELLKIMLPGAKNISDVTTVLDAIFNANKTRRNSPNSPEVAANEQLAMAALEGMVQDPAAIGRAQQIVHDMIVGKIRDPRPGGDFGGRGGPGGGRGGNQRDQRGGPRNRDSGDGGLGKQERTAKPPAEETRNQGDADAGQTNLGANSRRTGSQGGEPLERTESRSIDPPEKVVEPPVFEGSKNVAGGEETLVGPGKKVEAAPMNDMFDWSRPPQTEMERLLREAFLKRTRGKGKERSEDRGFEEEGDGRGKKERNQGPKRRGGARNLTRDYLEGDFDGDGG